MWTSKGNGHTWSEGKTVSTNPPARDGMPVPLLLNDHSGIAIAIEEPVTYRAPEGLSVDGQLGEAAWEGAHETFVDARGPTQARYFPLWDEDTCMYRRSGG